MNKKSFLFSICACLGFFVLQLSFNYFYLDSKGVDTYFPQYINGSLEFSIPNPELYLPVGPDSPSAYSTTIPVYNSTSIPSLISKMGKDSGVTSTPESSETDIVNVKQISPADAFFSYSMTSLFSSTEIYLFIVNLDEDSSVPYEFLKSSYFPYFRKHFRADFDVLFLSTHKLGSSGILCISSDGKDNFVYHSFSIAFDRYIRTRVSPYAGVFVMKGSSYIDASFLNDYDLSRSFMEPSIQLTNKTDWIWNTRMNSKGTTYWNALFQSISQIEDTDEIVLMLNTTNGSIQSRKGFADFFYVANKDLTLFYELEAIMYENKVYVEAAVATMLYSLSAYEIVDCNHGEMRKRETCVHMHPMSFINQTNQDFALKRLQHQNLYEKVHSIW